MSGHDPFDLRGQERKAADGYIKFTSFITCYEFCKQWLIAVDLFVGNLGAKAQAEALNQGADTAQKLGQVKTQNGRSN